MICCQTFEELFKNRGQKGISVILKSQMGISFFCLQSRGISADESEKVRRGEIQLLGVNLLHEIGIKVCPFCGTRLDEWIKKNQTIVRELAASSKKYSE